MASTAVDLKAGMDRRNEVRRQEYQIVTRPHILTVKDIVVHLIFLNALFISIHIFFDGYLSENNGSGSSIPNEIQ